jgi:hypothetical protein
MINLKFAVRHFLHQLKAINRHGLHSPFVYRLVDKVIYDFTTKNVYTELEKQLNNGQKLNKVDKLLYRIVNDAQPGQVYFGNRTEPSYQVIIKAAAPRSQTNASQPVELILLDASDLAGGFETYLPVVHEQTLMIVNHVYRNPDVWNTIKAHPRVTITVDLFWIGLVYFRKGQVKEDFKIKF